MKVASGFSFRLNNIQHFSTSNICDVSHFDSTISNWTVFFSSQQHAPLFDVRSLSSRHDGPTINCSSGYTFEKSGGPSYLQALYRTLCTTWGCTVCKIARCRDWGRYSLPRVMVSTSILHKYVESRMQTAHHLIAFRKCSGG